MTNEQAMREEIEHLKAERDTAIKRAQAAEDERDGLGRLVHDKAVMLQRAEAERDALATHVGRVKSILGGLCGKDFNNRRADQELFSWYTDAPATSLARQKSLWQAESLEDVEKHFRSKMDDPSLICLIEASHLGKIAEQYRSQAEADQ